jgi:putative hemin transport protein
LVYYYELNRSLLFLYRKHILYHCCLQIHTGKAEKIVRTGPWINILDDKFNLHLNDSEIDSLWIVKKPTNLGLVHSIEAFDREGNLIIQFFGKRKPSIPESEDWRKIVKSIENQI